MKKSMVLLVSVLVLTACAQPKKEAKESTENKTEQSTKASSSAKEEKGLKFVVAPQNEGKTSDLIELGKKLVREHPEVGAQGEITVYFTGGTYTFKQQEYAVFMLVNKTTTNLDRDATFKISWSYAGQQIYQNELVGVMMATLFIKIKWSSIVYLITLSYRHNQRPFYCFP